MPRKLVAMLFYAHVAELQPLAQLIDRKPLRFLQSFNDPAFFANGLTCTIQPFDPASPAEKLRIA